MGNCIYKIMKQTSECSSHFWDKKAKQKSCGLNLEQDNKELKEKDSNCSRRLS